MAEVAILVLANETHADISISLQDAVREVGDSSVYVVGADLKNRMTLAVSRVARNVLEIDQSSKAGTVREAVEHFGLLDRYDAVVIIDEGTQILPGFGRVVEDGLVLPGFSFLWEVEPDIRPKLLLAKANDGMPGKTGAVARMSGGIAASGSSVCILCPAYNEEAVLDRTLMAAVAEVGPGNVYVANDASKDHTAHVAGFWTEGNVYTSPQNQGKSRALHGAIEHFAITERYEAMFLLDSDTHLSPGHIAPLQARLEADVACVVGRIESEWVSGNFWVAYRAFVMWLYNGIIRTPQNVLNVINVLPGSSVLISNDAVRRIDWERAARQVLDDFSMMCDIRYGKLGKVVYLHNTPPASIAEPLTFRAYLKQTYGRWWPGIWQTMRDRRMFTKTDWFSIANNLQIFTWVWSATLPVIVFLAYWLQNGAVAVFLIPIMVGSQLAHMFVLAGLYAYRKRRPRTLILLPAFVAVAYLESLLFTLGFLKSFRLGKDGRWESPARVAATVTKRG